MSDPVETEDLTAAYMAGYERGKDAAQSDLATLRAALDEAERALERARGDLDWIANNPNGDRYHRAVFGLAYVVDSCDRIRALKGKP